MNIPAIRIIVSALLVAPMLSNGAISSARAEETVIPVSRMMSVTKSPTCGCCAAWVDLAREQGYKVAVTDTDDFDGMKQKAGVPEDMQACHTTRIGEYIVEGHVPFAAVEKLMSERPDIDGIAVPGMPRGSPGMGDDPSAVYEVKAYGGSAGDGIAFYQSGQ